MIFSALLYALRRQLRLSHGLMVGLWTGVVTACVDPINLNLTSTTDILVVSSRITNRIGAQQVRLSRAKSDPLTGRPGSLPVTGASVALLVDSSQTIALKETDAGTYQAPADFVGQVGHAYQLRFTLADGRRYTSSTEVMQAVPPISQVRAQFNANSLPPDQRLEKVYAAAHDFYITTQDPAAQHNYYHWGWKLWERQDWCCSCSNAIYLVYDPTNPAKRYEACFDVSPYIYSQYFTYDYNCRSRCWEVFEGFAINVFDDQYTNGGIIGARRVAQIPFYQHEGCLVEIQQGALTAGAYRYYKLLEDQTQNTGGLADTPPTLLAGNVYNNANSKESVIGYFTAEAVTSVRYWLDRQDTQTTPPGLFHALTSREPNPEDNRPKGFGFLIYPNADRPPTALCIESDNRTPNKPPGWRD